MVLNNLFFIFKTVEEGNDEEFEDMMDQLLERDANAPEMIAEMSSGGLDSTLDDTHHDSQMLTQDESQIEAQQMSQDEEVCIFFLNLVHFSDKNHN